MDTLFITATNTDIRKVVFMQRYRRKPSNGCSNKTCSDSAWIIEALKINPPENPLAVGPAVWRKLS